MTQPSQTHLDLIFEDEHLLVVNKRAMLATMGVGPEKISLLDLAKAYLREKYQKQGNVYLGIVSRLDAPVTGLVVMARTSKAARRLSEAFRQSRVEKIYWALVDGQLHPREARLEHYLRKDERHRHVHTTHAGCPDAQYAWLEYRVLRQGTPWSLVEVRPGTGRKHQIRVQISKVGYPIAGDRKYGSRSEFPNGIGLHARRLVLAHPVRDQLMEFEAPIPAAWSTQRGVKRLLG